VRPLAELLIDKTERPSGADRSVEADKLIVDIDGYEGPLDLLLDLA